MYCFQVLTLHVFWYTSLDFYVAGTATYGLKPYWDPRLIPFHSRDRVPLAINSSATATRLIKIQMRALGTYLCRVGLPPYIDVSY